MHLRRPVTQRLETDAFSRLDGGYARDSLLGRGLRRLRGAAVRHAPVALSIAILASLTYGTVSFFEEEASVFSAGTLTGVWSSWVDVVLNPWFTAYLVGMAVLQWKFPADPKVRLRSPGTAQDVFWYFYAPIRDITVIAAFLTALGVGMDQVSQWQLNLVPALGIGGVAVTAFVVSDFAAWFSHILHHRFPLLWEFHKVHHSQREMSFMTDNREHFVETIINAAIVYVPARLLGLESEAAGALAFLQNYLQTLSHANVRTNLGPLRFILVSPQYHRIHHSILREHYNVNYGSVLSVWDYLFRTFFPDKNAYPPTGINDEEFPLEQSVNPASLARTWWLQTLYPFKRNLARWREHRAVPAAEQEPAALAPQPQQARALAGLAADAFGAPATPSRESYASVENR